MAKIFEFPDIEKEIPHHWSHTPYIYTAMRFKDYECLFCAKCRKWKIRKKINWYTTLYIEEWVKFETFSAIINQELDGPLRPRRVWHLIRLELYLKSAQAQSGAKK